MDGSSALQHPQSSHGPHIRSRITVVCAECKRLKLKCDRRTPCSSCQKRDTVPRCIYSAAAAEKIDIQSLHNRILTLEAQVSQLSSEKGKAPSNDLDHALLAVGVSGSSVLVPSEETSTIWLDALDITRDTSLDFRPSFPSLSESEMLPPRSLAAAHPAFSPLSAFSSITVTPALMAMLPPPSQRPGLLDSLASIMRAHPSLNYPHLRRRIESLGTESMIAPTGETEKPTLSFFAVVCAAYALALQCTPSSPPSTSSSPHALLALSTHALTVFEASANYDLDYVCALAFRVLGLLREGAPQLHQSAFATVGRMVNVSRLMGLARDPDEFPGRYNVWEAEMRRRMWWEVFYYDLFVSDCLGFAPLVSDDQHSCRLPAVVDEDSFSPTSTTLPAPSGVESQVYNTTAYLVQKYKLAQLVKNMKKRPPGSFPPPPSPPSPSFASPDPSSFDLLVQAESEVQQFLADLPPMFKLDLDAEPSSPSSQAHQSTIVHSWELLSLSSQLIIALFQPYLRRTNPSSGRPPHHAIHAGVNAAHAIIHSTRIARHFTSSSPHSVFYPLAKGLFTAAVVSAYGVLLDPQSATAKVALEDVRIALELLNAEKDGAKESVKVVEAMLARATAARQGRVSLGVKRKIEDVEGSVVEDALVNGDGWTLPFVGSGITASASSANASSTPGSPKKPEASPRVPTSHPKERRNTTAATGRIRALSGSLDMVKSGRGAIPRPPSVPLDTRSGREHSIAPGGGSSSYTSGSEASPVARIQTAPSHPHPQSQPFHSPSSLIPTPASLYPPAYAPSPPAPPPSTSSEAARQAYYVGYTPNPNPAPAPHPNPPTYEHLHPFSPSSASMAPQKQDPGDETQPAFHWHTHASADPQAQAQSQPQAPPQPHHPHPQPGVSGHGVMPYNTWSDSYGFWKDQ